MINVGSEITTTKVEELLSEVSESSARKYVDLRLPINLKATGFGAFAALIQLLITWRRLENCGRLIVGSKEVTDDQIEDISRNFYGLIASVISWDQGVINFNGADIKPVIRKYNTAT